MEEFLILFMGLISHFGIPQDKPTYERAVLIEHDFHTPVLMLRDEDLAPVEAVELNRIECPKGNENEPVKCYSLVDVQLRFKGLGKGTPKPIDDHIPRLRVVTDGNTAAKAVKKPDVNFAHAFGYIDYNGGCLVAPVYAVNQMKWNPGYCNAKEGPLCVTPDILYAGKATEPYVTVEIVQPPGRKPFRLKRNAFVVIEVVPQGNHGMLADYKEHRFLNGATCIADMQELQVDGATQPCPQPLPTPCLRFPKPLDIRYLDTLTLGGLIQRYNLQAGCTGSQGGPP